MGYEFFVFEYLKIRLCLVLKIFRKGATNKIYWNNGHIFISYFQIRFLVTDRLI